MEVDILTRLRLLLEVCHMKCRGRTGPTVVHTRVSWVLSDPLLGMGWGEGAIDLVASQTKSVIRHSVEEIWGPGTVRDCER